MRFKVHDFCDLAKFAKLSNRRMFSPKASTKLILNQITISFAKYSRYSVSRHSVGVCTYVCSVV